MTPTHSLFGELRSLLARADEPFDEVCDLIDAWEDPEHLDAIALPYARDHLARWRRRRVAPWRWVGALLQGDACPELTLCDGLDLRPSCALATPVPPQELAELLYDAEELSNVRECWMPLLPPGWADCMSSLERLHLVDALPVDTSGMLDGVPSIAFLGLHGHTTLSEREFVALDERARGGALEGVSLSLPTTESQEAVHDWLVRRAPRLTELELSGGWLDQRLVHEAAEAMRTSPGGCRVERLCIPSAEHTLDALIQSERFGRVLELGVTESGLEALARSPHAHNLEALHSFVTTSILAARQTTPGGVLDELTHATLSDDLLSGARGGFASVLGGPRVRALRALRLLGPVAHEDVVALSENRWAGALRELHAHVRSDDGRFTFLMGPALGRLERLSLRTRAPAATHRLGSLVEVLRHAHGLRASLRALRLVDFTLDASVSELASMLPNLVELDLVHCRLDDASSGLDALDLPDGSGLRRLELPYTIPDAPAALEETLGRLGRLEVLGFAHDTSSLMGMMRAQDFSAHSALCLEHGVLLLERNVRLARAAIDSNTSPHRSSLEWHVVEPMF